jgi:glycosyltransferase involved in cell wall biosynthesis
MFRLEVGMFLRRYPRMKVGDNDRTTRGMQFMRRSTSLPAQIVCSFHFASPAENLSRVRTTAQVTGLLSSFRFLREVWRARKTADVLLIDGVLPQMWVGWLQTYLPGCGLKVIVTECLWEWEPKSFRGYLKLRVMRLMLQRIDKCILYAKADIPKFAEYYQVDPLKFVFIPFFNTLHPQRYTYAEIPGGYVFSGGNSDRDYASLVEAMRSLDAQCLIACRPAALKGLDMPTNVYRVEANSGQFRQLLKSAAIVVVAMKGGSLRSAGQQTFLNAMRLGKPVIVTDPEGAQDYIQNGETGLTVRPGDPQALRQALEMLLHDPATYSRIAANAQVASADLTIENISVQICAIADQLVATARK